MIETSVSLIKFKTLRILTCSNRSFKQTWAIPSRSSESRRLFSALASFTLRLEFSAIRSSLCGSDEANDIPRVELKSYKAQNTATLQRQPITVSRTTKVWVSSFLTSHEHIKHRFVPSRYIVEIIMNANNEYKTKEDSEILTEWSSSPFCHSEVWTGDG